LPPWVRGRIVAVGDAAGLVDPLTAEGISPAIRSGRLAAEAILDADLRPDYVDRLYEQRLRRQVLPTLRASRLLAHLVYAQPLQRVVYRTIGQRLARAILQTTTSWEQRPFAGGARADNRLQLAGFGVGDTMEP
jgi:flavin-dependent dehydrogenase